MHGVLCDPRRNSPTASWLPNHAPHRGIMDSARLSKAVKRPLPDRTRYRIASAGWVEPEPPVLITALLIVRVALGAD